MLNLFLLPRQLSVAVILIAFNIVLLFVPIDVQGRNQDRKAEAPSNSEAMQNTKEPLPVNLGEKWRAINRLRILKPDQWNILPNSDVYAEYGLQNIISRIYSNGKTKATVEVFEMQFPSGAYGLFTFNRGSLSPNRHEFHLGRYLISIAIDQNGKSIDPSLLEESKKYFLSDPGELPFLPSHLPEHNKIADSEKYIIGPAVLSQIVGFSDLKDVVNFDGGVEIVTADYNHGDGKMRLIIIEYQTPQAATFGMTKASEYLGSLDQNERNRRILKRIGNYVVHAVNVKDSSEAEKIFSQIKYNPKVYWEGKKFSDIPVQFRPPDPAAIEEAKQTIKVVVRSFYWVGIMMIASLFLGLIAGCSYFYWRRYRRRKLGFDDLFSDAGDTVRLNLDDFLLQPDEPSIKRIGDGKH